MENDKKEFDVAFRAKLLDTFKRTIAFLDKNNIRWCACGGTVLGAVRHKGMIPWDDDVDIWVPREDYNRLVEFSDTLKESNLELISLTNDKTYYNIMSKICDTNCSLWESKELLCMYGIYVDIFPLDETNDSPEQYMQKHSEAFKWRAKYQGSISRKGFYELLRLIIRGHFRTVINVVFNVLKRPCSKTYRRKFIEAEAVYSNDNGSNVCTIGGSYNEKDLMPKYWIFPFNRLQFEGVTINVPNDYDKYLTYVYGDYMTPPPVEKQVTPHFHYYCNLKERVSVKEAKRRLKKGIHFELE